MDEAEWREAEAAEIDEELARVCGTVNAATARLVELIARVLDNGAYAVAGVRSAQHWVAWKCGVSPRRARSLVAMARRLRELPETAAAFAAGELCEDQVAVICRHIPTHNDAEVAELARYATVSQLRRVLSRYVFDPPPDPDAEPEVESPPPEPRRVSFGFDDDGAWRLSALLPPDEGAAVERALATARQDLRSDAEVATEGVSWPDALVAVAERSLASDAAARPHHDRHLVVVHLDADAEGRSGSLHLGPALPDALRRQLGCDARGRIVLTHRGVAISVGRTRRIVPERTRVAVERRDGGCRVPGCDRRRWLQVHHLKHWEDGGRTDTPNLVALCSPTTACITGGPSGSRATPTTHMGWCSATSGEDPWPPVAAPRPPVSSPSPPATPIPAASASTPTRWRSAHPPAPRLPASRPGTGPSRRRRGHGRRRRSAPSPPGRTAPTTRRSSPTPSEGSSAR